MAKEGIFVFSSRNGTTIDAQDDPDGLERHATRPEPPPRTRKLPSPWKRGGDNRNINHTFEARYLDGPVWRELIQNRGLNTIRLVRLVVWFVV